MITTEQEKYLEKIAEITRLVRNDAIEECAKIVETIFAPKDVRKPGLSKRKYPSQTSILVSQAIRNLKVDT